MYRHYEVTLARIGRCSYYGLHMIIMQIVKRNIDVYSILQMQFATKQQQADI